jgi:hypothetical protein
MVNFSAVPSRKKKRQRFLLALPFKNTEEKRKDRNQTTLIVVFPRASVGNEGLPVTKIRNLADQSCGYRKGV